MKKTILILVATLFMGIGFNSCAPKDEKIAKEVTTAIASYAGVKAEVKDGVVTITGIAENESTRSQIEALAKSIKGVKSVVNSLDIKPKVVINPDETISTSVTTALAAGGFKDVIATVKDGEVTLTGDLKRADLIKVMQIVNATSPKKVNNQLTLK